VLLVQFEARGTKTVNSEAVFVCPHVADHPETVGFYCRTQDGLFAACSENCKSIETGEGLAYLHAEHLAISIELMRLPINICATVESQNSALRYFDDPYSPTEGDVVACLSESRWRTANRSESVFHGLTSSGRAISLTFRNGLQCIPFWSDGTSAQHFIDQNGDRGDTAVGCALQSVKKIAQSIGIQFLAPDFDLDPMVDWVLLAED
jgi:hypothetical protein